MLNKHVYLAGPIFGKADAECMGWRMDAAHWLRLRGFKPVDPMRRDYRGREDICPEKIVSQDQEDIFSCGYILANANVPSWGTAIELAIGHAAGCTVVAFAAFHSCPAISPWLRRYTDAIYESLDHALAGITSGSTHGMR